MGSKVNEDMKLQFTDRRLQIYDRVLRILQHFTFKFPDNGFSGAPNFTRLDGNFPTKKDFSTAQN